MSKVIKLKKGLNIPLLGAAEKILITAETGGLYALKPTDFHAIFPKLTVKEGDRVLAGDSVFFDKYNESHVFTSPVSGKILEVVRGEKRVIQEIRIEAEAEVEYKAFGTSNPKDLSAEEIINQLQKSGLWVGIRQRPFNLIANANRKPKSIFISAFDSAPLAPDLDFVVHGQQEEFQTGLDALAKLTQGQVHLNIHLEQTTERAFTEARNVVINKFKGPHPAGNVGVQIHHIDPLVDKDDMVWVVQPQHVVMIGRFFMKGVYDARKIVALTGSEIHNPKYYRVISGTSIKPLVKNATTDIKKRFISGNVLTGKKIQEDGFLGYYDNQITVIPEGDEAEFFGWMLPKPSKFSVSRSFPAFLMPWKKFRLDANLHGGERAFVMTGHYEKVLPMDIYPLQLFKSIMINDIDMMEKLGILELDEEDVALCEFVCTSKTEIQHLLRQGLDTMRKEFS